MVSTWYLSRQLKHMCQKAPADPCDLDEDWSGYGEWIYENICVNYCTDILAELQGDGQNWRSMYRSVYTWRMIWISACSLRPSWPKYLHFRKCQRRYGLKGPCDVGLIKNVQVSARCRSDCPLSWLSCSYADFFLWERSADGVVLRAGLTGR